MSAVLSSRKSTLSLNPIQAITDMWKGSLAETDFKAAFFERNEQKVVKPFLNGIGIEYVLVDQLLIVKDTANLSATLGALGFQSADAYFSGTKWKNTPASKHLKDITKRLYHKEYNIEVYIQPTEKWPLVTTAQLITQNLMESNKPSNKQTEVFLSVYDSLHILESQSKG